MALTAKVLFDSPQQEIASTLRSLVQSCRSARIITGFATVAGIETLRPSLDSQPSKLHTLIVGASTFQAFEAMDSLLAAGVPSANLLVHLGHARLKGKDPNKVWGYHPMLHSKVYLFELDDVRSAALVSGTSIYLKATALFGGPSLPWSQKE